jgi:hypothetical protein
VRADSAAQLGTDPGPEIDAGELLRAVEAIHERA